MGRIAPGVIAYQGMEAETGLQREKLVFNAIATKASPILHGDLELG